MGLRFIREPSETPNILVGDDVRAFRYAYGDQNGYVKGKGLECQHEINGVEFKVKSGEVVINGYASEIDANGVILTVDNIATKRYYIVYYQVNLGTSTVGIMATYDTATYPVLDTGDDLSVNTIGTARMELYRFTATSGLISGVVKSVKQIYYSANTNGTYSNLTAGDSQKINNITILADGLLIKADGWTLPKKKLIYSYSNGAYIGTQSARKLIFTHTESLANKKLQIEYSYINTSYDRNISILQFGSNKKLLFCL